MEVENVIVSNIFPLVPLINFKLHMFEYHFPWYLFSLSLSLFFFLQVAHLIDLCAHIELRSIGIYFAIFTTLHPFSEHFQPL